MQHISELMGTGLWKQASAEEVFLQGKSSHMLTRAVLLEKSKGMYRGLIRILPGASKCDAYQREDALLLGDESRMDAVPILEIKNDDVKCSHGVTLGQVNEEQLFYLET